MKQITFYFDFLSPYAYLAFEQLPVALQGCSYNVRYQPILLPAVFRHHGQTPPVDIAPKRKWIARHVQWLAKEHGVDLQLPAAHPFNPLPLLRLALACDAQGAPNRYVVETIFRHVWQGGAHADSSERVQALTAKLAPVRDAGSEEIKTELKDATVQAIGQGVFGVPTLLVDGELFWGFDSLGMLKAL